MRIDIDEDQARLYGLTDRAQINLLATICLWLNGYNFRIGNADWSIGSRKEPPLMELVKAGQIQLTEEAATEAHTALLNRGLLKEDYLCKRKVDWLITENGHTVINNVLHPTSALYPSWVRDHSEITGPLVTQKHELHHHHKGVARVEHLGEQLDFIEQVRKNPRDGKIVAPDLFLLTSSKYPDWAVEMIVEANKFGECVEKWNQLARGDFRVLWVFDSRTAMFDFYNSLHRDDLINLPKGPFSGHPDAWSAKTVTERLIEANKSSEHSSEAAHLTCTLTALVENDSSDFGQRLAAVERVLRKWQRIES